jgi:KaiC/GvpD/RAD55 family RecA-like ATPase
MDGHGIRIGSLGKVILVLLASITIKASTVTASTTTSVEIPFFIKGYILLLGLHHASMMALVWEIKRVSLSDVWDNIFYANVCGIFITFTLALLLYNLYIYSSFGQYILVSIVILDIIAHIFADMTTYYLVKPIIKGKLSLFRNKYIVLYTGLPVVLYGMITNGLGINFPSITTPVSLYILGLFFAVIIFYFIYSPFTISEAYAKMGFVRKPFLLAGIGAITFVFSAALVLYFAFNYIGPEIQQRLFYNISFYILASIFSLIFFIKFIIEYPSLLQPKWKALMPFDLPKVATAITLAFLAVSMYYTVKDSPNFFLYQDLNYRLAPFLLPVFAAIVLILVYIKGISTKTELRYWRYLKAGLLIHVGATFYVFAMLNLLTPGMTTKELALAATFGIFAFGFYLFYALDLRKVITDLEIKVDFNGLDIVRYGLSLVSLFLIILFGLSFTYGKEFGAAAWANLESYPLILFFVAAFLVAFATYLSISHKGFEEIMKKNIWSELSYISSLLIFLSVYLVYITVQDIEKFPFRDAFFLGYFIVLLAEIISIRTLAPGSYQEGRMDIEKLLNFHAGSYLRADYLGQMWDAIVDRYGTPDNRLAMAGFSPGTRTFDLHGLDKKTRITAAAAMLLEMYSLPADFSKITPLKVSLSRIKEEIEKVLGEDVLLLPDGLKTEIGEDKYYPLLFEKTVNNLIEDTRTFIPLEEQVDTFNKLARTDKFFSRISFSDSRIKLPEDTRMSREEFIVYFKKYLSHLESLFPYELVLLYGPIKMEINRELLNYGFSPEDLMDIVPTGTEVLDEAAEGGLHKKTNTLIIAEETRAKNLFLLSFAAQGVIDNDNVVYVTSKKPYTEIKDSILATAGQMKNTIIIDLHLDIYTTEQVKGMLEREDRMVIPSNLTLFRAAIVKAIKKIDKSAHKRIVIDAYNDLTKYYAWDEMQDILLRQVEGLRKWNCTSIITLDPTLIPPEVMENLKMRFENVMTITGRGKRSFLHIEKLYGGTPQDRTLTL